MYMLNYVLRNAKRFLFQFSRLVPKKARRPFYSIAMVISAYIFMIFMMSITKSVYLINANNFIMSFIVSIFNQHGKEMFVFMIIGILCLFTYFVYRAYEIFQTTLFFVWLAIFIAGILPWLTA